jgi:hypothetical protein
MLWCDMKPITAKLKAVLMCQQMSELIYCIKMGKNVAVGVMATVDSEMKMKS